MTTSRVLIIDDAVAMLRMTASVLRKDGYQVHIASNAEEALTSLQTLRPDVILVDLRLPGISGLGFTQRVRQDSGIKDTVVLAMTAFYGLDVEKAARDAGCDGFIAKPFDTKTLTAFVRHNLEPQSEALPARYASATSITGERRRAFLDDACSRCRVLASGFDEDFQASNVTGVLRQLAEDAAQYGYRSIPRLANETAELLEGLFWHRPQLKDSMNKLLAALVDLKSEAEAALFPALAGKLKGMRIALTGFDAPDTARIQAMAERYGASVQMVPPGRRLEQGILKGFDAAIVRVGGVGTDALWMSPEASGVPLIFAGEHHQLMSLDPKVLSRAREILVDDWQGEEALLRLGLALSRASASQPSAAVTEGVPPTILIVDDDASIRRLLQVTLQNLGMRCLVAADGEEARQHLAGQPDVAIIDINLPTMDGFEVMGVIRLIRRRFASCC